MTQADPMASALAVREAGPDVREPRAQPSAWALTVAVGGVLIFFAICLFAPDWGTAAAQAAEVASVLALICLGTGLVYLLLGARPGWLSWLVVGTLLAVLGFYELPTAVTPLRVFQAHIDATAGRYDAAYRELRLSGVGPCDPRAIDLVVRGARADARAGQYDAAIRDLRERLIGPCPTNPAAATARDEIVRVELDWANQLERAGHYPEALARYQTVLATYPSAPEAHTAYDGAARTLYDWGQAETRAGKYTQAASTYGQLLDEYPDTAQAAQAAQLLRAPQRVAGRLIHADGSPAVGVKVRLSSAWGFTAGGYTASGRQFIARTDAAGMFAFEAVPVGSYLLDWQDSRSEYTTFLDQTGQPLYVVSVQPLRPLTLANINVDPSSQG